VHDFIDPEQGRETRTASSTLIGMKRG
jgi:hypothetical protein